MKGFAKLFKNLGKAVDAKAEAQAEKIDSENSVAFAKQEIQQLKTDLNTVLGNIGTIKGEYAVLQDKIKGIKADIKKHDDDAKSLAEAGNEKLAVKHCEAAEALEPQLESLNLAAKTQKEMLDEQMKAKDDLKSAIQQQEAGLTTLKAMNDAASANEKLAKVSTGNTSSALAKLNQRNEEAKKRLIRSRAIKEEGEGDTSLEKETAAALGNAGASSRLARLTGK